MISCNTGILSVFHRETTILLFKDEHHKGGSQNSEAE